MWKLIESLKDASKIDVYLTFKASLYEHLTNNFTTINDASPTYVM